MIDKNKGVDYSKKILKKWKEDHESKIMERLRSQKPLKSTKSDIESVIESSETYFQKMLSTYGIGGALEIRLIIYPDTPIEKKTTRDELRGLIKSLYTKPFGPPSGVTFDFVLRRLQLHRRGLFNFSKIEDSSYGCIGIFSDGTIIYQYNYFDSNLHRARNKLSMESLSVILLGFIDFIFFYYRKIEFMGKLNLLFKANNLLGWWYSKFPYYLPVDEAARYTSHANYFDPFKSQFNLNSISGKAQRVEVVQSLLIEFLLDFGFDDGFSIDKRILAGYFDPS